MPRSNPQPPAEPPSEPSAEKREVTFIVASHGRQMGSTAEVPAAKADSLVKRRLARYSRSPE